MSMLSSTVSQRGAALLPNRHAAASGSRRPRVVSVQAASLTAVSRSRSWQSVAQDVKSRLASTMESNQSRMEQLMLWLGETRLDLEAEAEVRCIPHWEASEWREEYQSVADALLQQWFAKTTPSAEVEAKMAGLLTMRVLQEYNEYTGEAFNSSDSAFVKLEAFLPAVLGEALDRSALERMISAWGALPSEQLETPEEIAAREAAEAKARVEEAAAAFAKAAALLEEEKKRAEAAAAAAAAKLAAAKEPAAPTAAAPATQEPTAAKPAAQAAASVAAAPPAVSNGASRAGEASAPASPLPV